jgi:hypothetical protein
MLVIGLKPFKLPDVALAAGQLGERR